MLKTEPNDTMYPIIDTEERAGETFYTEISSRGGLTKREYIATQVLNGLISAWGAHDVTDYNDLAHDAVMAADALITSLNKEQ